VEQGKTVACKIEERIELAQRLREDKAQLKDDLKQFEEGEK
jgi:hypothetical protein